MKVKKTEKGPENSQLIIFKGYMVPTPTPHPSIARKSQD
jgi:hypothetical protein